MQMDMISDDLLTEAAELLGYERVGWDADNDCYSGYGSADPCDRSRDDAEPLFVAWDDDELLAIVDRSR